MDFRNASHRTATEKCDNNGKSWYLQFDNDNWMSYKYILSIA